MMTYRAVTFFDLDGTLLDGNSEVSPEIIDLIKQLKANDILPVIATGRTELEIDHIMQKSGIDSVIVMNGQLIRMKGQELYSELISKDICHRMRLAAMQMGHQLSYYNARNIWCTEQTDMLIQAYEYIHSIIPPENPNAYETNPINMLLILSEDGDDYYKEQFPELTFYRNGPYSIDIVKKGISKGTGVKEMQRQLKLQQVPTYGFGDGPNDLDLLLACDYKIAMGNAKPELKAIADYTTAKNTEGGIAQALAHYNLI